MNWTLITITVDVTRFHLEFFSVFHIRQNRHAIRKFIRSSPRFYRFSRFEGNSFKVESSSNYPHAYVNVLGVYKGAPFVTGSYSPGNKKTEILDYASNQWNVAADYPFSSGEGGR